ncbi:MAG: YaeQ family protein [Limisphaerales bacterium]
MSKRYSFRLKSSDPRRELPHKLLLSQDYEETQVHVLHRLLGYLLFFRERLEVTANLQNDNIPFRPDLVELDYQLRPILWVECGPVTTEKLDRLAIKAPDAKIWILQPSPEDAAALHQSMHRLQLRTNRYQILALDAVLIQEMTDLLQPRNDVFWVSGTFDPPLLQFEFNGLWFDHEFTILPH